MTYHQNILTLAKEARLDQPERRLNLITTKLGNTMLRFSNHLKEAKEIRFTGVEKPDKTVLIYLTLLVKGTELSYCLRDTHLEATCEKSQQFAITFFTALNQPDETGSSEQFLRHLDETLAILDQLLS